MPIDSSIALGIRPLNLQQQDPLEQYSKGLALKSLMNKGQMEDSALADDAAVRSAYQNAAGDSTRLRALLQGGGQYKAVQALDKFDLEKRKDEAEIDQKKASTLKTNLEADINKAQHAASILSVAKSDPSQYPAVLSMLKMQYPQLAKSLPEQYDPRAIEMQLSNGMTYVQKLEGQRADATAAEVRRHNRSTEEQAAATANRDRLQIVTDTEGNITVVDKNTLLGRPAVDAQGNPLKGRQNLTESQGKASGMALRAREANTILSKLETEGVTNRGVIKQAASTLPLVGGAAEMGVNMLPGIMGGPSSQQQQVEQARRNFVNAVLRVESGASINESEFRNAEKQYFPMPGDSAATKKQKAANRETAIQALELQSGPQKAQKSNPMAPGGGSVMAPGANPGIKFLGWEG